MDDAAVVAEVEHLVVIAQAVVHFIQLRQTPKDRAGGRVERGDIFFTEAAEVDAAATVIKQYVLLFMPAIPPQTVKHFTNRCRRTLRPKLMSSEPFFVSLRRRRQKK